MFNTVPYSATETRKNGFVEFFLAGVLFFAAFNNLPAAIEVAGINLNVVFTLAALSISLFFVITSSGGAGIAGKPLFSYFLFLIFAFTSLIFTSSNTQSYQNLAVYLATGTVALMAFRYGIADGNCATFLTLNLKRMAWLSSALYLMSLSLSWTGSNGYFSPRSYALIIIIGIALYAAEAQVGRRWALFKSFVLLLLCLSTISRTASLMALLAFGMIWLDFRNLKSWIVTLFLVAICFLIMSYIAVSVSQFSSSFFGGDQALQIGSFAIDTKGRFYWWSLIWDSFMRSPFFGNGPGSFVPQLFLSIQPHNDHLRLLHDFGIIGYSLWLYAIAGSILTIIKGWKAEADFGGSGIVLLKGAVIFSVAFLGTMLTDNVLIYTVNVFPFAIMLGGALSIATLAITRRYLSPHV